MEAKNTETRKQMRGESLNDYYAEQEDDDSRKFCNTLIIDENLPNDSNTTIAKSFAEALCTDDFEKLRLFLMMM